MRTTIDAAGRLVVPKAVRTAVHLDGAAEVEVTARDGVIEIRPATVATRVVSTPEGPVAEPVEALPALTDDDVRGAVESLRR